MYNQKLKERFIWECANKSDSSRYEYETLFNRLEKYENEWGADFCTRNAEELQPVLEKICGIKKNSKWTRISILRKYVSWCIDNKVSGACDGIFHVNISDTEQIKRYSVVNAKHLQSYLDILFDPEDKKTIDNIYRCYYWLAYGGMREEDISEVKRSDLDFESMMVRYEKRYTAVPIYREGVKAFHNCAELDSFALQHPLYAKEVSRKRICGDELMRGSKSVLSVKVIRSRVSKASRENRDRTSLQLSYRRVWLSGLFYRIWEQEVMGIPVFFDDIAADDIEEREYEAETSKELIKNKIRIKANEYKRDYNSWKAAWNLK